MSVRKGVFCLVLIAAATGAEASQNVFWPFGFSFPGDRHPASGLSASDRPVETAGVADLAMPADVALFPVAAPVLPVRLTASPALFDAATVLADHDGASDARALSAR